MTVQAEERGAGRYMPVLVVGALVLGLAGFFLLRTRRDGTEPAPPGAVMTLVRPRGELDAPPARFEWQPVEGASRYTVKIEDADALWPLFVRSTAAPLLSLEPAEVAALRPDRVHAWEVSAYDDRGAVLASGGARFRIRPAAAP